MAISKKKVVYQRRAQVARGGVYIVVIFINVFRLSTIHDVRAESTVLSGQSTLSDGELAIKWAKKQF